MCTTQMTYDFLPVGRDLETVTTTEAAVSLRDRNEFQTHSTLHEMRTHFSLKQFLEGQYSSSVN